MLKSLMHDLLQSKWHLVGGSSNFLRFNKNLLLPKFITLFTQLNKLKYVIYDNIYLHKFSTTIVSTLILKSKFRSYFYNGQSTLKI